ncbi:nectin cell adhesion molecule 1a isoform X1 [Triplophysa rosa]|uniref:Poliovirus receptor-related protein 1 n=2 Tax=Triplophysa rosa TaxID=992332 RepID=A0A9W7TFG7_TRIRA|nr:nectin cell adhesion molecule 1a isoform X1 [Triplophysa rosa]KAI7795974.1 putative poliovirus receptor-related protein 1 [Triplophysa rosa]
MFLKFVLTLMALLKSGVHGQMVQMDSSKSGFVGSQVELRCQFVNSNPPVKISQVTWQKVVNGTKQNVAIANPALGVSVLQPFKERVRFKNPAVRQRTPSLEDTTVIFNKLRLSDESAYICEYTTFPAGNRENMVNLTVYARPMIQMSLSTPSIVAGSKDLKMTVATCVSANGKPPSVITWETSLDGESKTQEIRNPDGTVTVRSDYLVVPSRDIHQQVLTCVSTYNEEPYTDSVTLNIQYEPEVIIEGFDGNWYLNRENVQLTCLADANPPISLFQWRYLNGSLPSSAELRDDVLIFKGPVTYDIAGTYVCDATNSIGTGSASVEVTVTEFSSSPHEMSQKQQQAGIVIGGAVVCGTVLLAAITLLIVFLYRRRCMFKGDYSTKKQILGNGYSKAGSLQPHASLPHSLTFSEDSDEEKKLGLYRGSSILGGSAHEFHNYRDSRMKTFHTGLSQDNVTCGCNEQTYVYEYGSEVEVSVDMVPQMDGSVISKEEWYV